MRAETTNFVKIARLLLVLLLTAVGTIIVSLSALANSAQSFSHSATEVKSTLTATSTPNVGVSLPTLSIANLEDEEGFGVFAFYVSLSAPSASNVTGKVSTLNISATAPADFTALSNQPFTITAGATETFVYINIVDDSFRELTETFKVSVTQISNATVNPVEGGGWAYGSIVDDDTTPAVSIIDKTVSENAGTASMVLSLSAPHASATNVNIQTFEDSANTTLDFVGTTKSVSIPAGQISVTVPITIVNDALDEADEQFFVRITSASLLIEDDEAIVTITNDDAPPNLSVLPVSASEGEDVIIFHLIIDAPSGRDITGLANTSNGTAKSVQDYVAQINKIFTIPSGITETTIYIPVYDETLYEKNETFTLTISSVANANVSVASNIGTILNDDTAPVLNISDATDNESKPLQFSISLEKVSAVDAVGTVTTSNKTALAGSDYVAAANLPFTITAGSLTTTVTLDLIDNLLNEATESFTLTVNSLTDAIGGDVIAVGTILDNDILPMLSINDANGDEGTSSMTFTLSLNTPSELNVSGYINTQAETATGNQDYTSLSIYPFTIPAGLTSTQIAVTIVDDALDENTETFSLYTINVESAALLKDNGIGTIYDNDELPTLDISSTSFMESSSGVITATLNVVSGRAVTGTLTTADGSALANLDYGPLNGKLFTIPPGQLSAIVEFYIIDDTIDEYDEDLHVALITSNNAITGTSAVDITLFDNDDEPTINVIATAASESQATMSIPVRLDHPSGKTVTGTVTTSDGNALSTTDYGAISQTPFTIAPGQTEALIAVSLINDSLDESDETFAVTLDSATNTTLGTTTANATILDDDAPPLLTIGNVSGDESSGTFTFTISIDAISSLTATGKISTVNGTAKGGSDFVALNNVPFEIPAGTLTKTFSITINEDASDEYDEQFQVSVNNIVNAQPSNVSAVATIFDNDAPPTVTISDATASEGSGSLAFNVSVSVASGKDIKLQVNTFDGTATSPSDYVKQSDRSFTIAAGKSTEAIVVQLVNDPNDEPDETLTLQTSLIDPSTASLLTTTLTGTILDDDLPPTLTVADVSASEASGQIVFTLKLSAPSAFPIDGTISTSNGSATAGADYSALSGLVFNVPIGSDQTTIPVTLLNDLALESNETFTFTVVTLTGATKQDPVAIGTIQDEDSTGSGTLTLKVNVAPKSIQNFKFSPPFGSEFYLDDEADGAQSDSYTSSKSFTLAAGTYQLTPTTPYSYFLMDIVCTSGGVTIKTGTTPQLPVLGSGQSVICTFYNERGITIRSQSYNDLSKNRLYDKVDTALAGVETKLFVTSATNPLITETTDTNGRINWSYRKPGPYTVCASKWPLAVPLMVQPTLVDPDYGLPCYRFDLRPGAIADVYFGFRVDDGTVMAAIEGINEYDPSLTDGSMEAGVLFSQMPDVTDDMQGYDETAGTDESNQEEQSMKVYLPVVTR